jgi:hypothetical protein
MEVDGREPRQKSCLSELHQSTLTLCNLYDMLPAAIAVRPDFINGGYDSVERDNTLDNSRIEWEYYGA